MASKAESESPRRIVYLPLDERPCNLLFPRMQVPQDGRIELRVPPDSLLGHKKQPADREALVDWLRAELPGADSAVISLEMLLYGGLLSSRIHADEAAAVAERLDAFAELLRDARASRRGAAGRADGLADGADALDADGELDVSLFGLIMRTPSYSSAEEEPDYYARYGREIFLRGYLQDKANRHSLSRSEAARLGELACIPEEIVQDYDRRRAANLGALMGVGRLLADGSAQRLVLPEDDTAEYGYGPREKRALMARFAELGVSDRVFSYPGADEVGSILTARAAIAGHGPPSVYPLYSSHAAAGIVPRYESQPLALSVAAQIEAAGGVQASRPEDADVLLVVVAPEGRMEEAAAQYRVSSHIQETRYRSHVDLAEEISRCSEAAPPSRTLAIADCVFANGADDQLVRALRDRGLWGRIDAYAAWNTSGNTVGTVIARAVLEHTFPDRQTRERNLIYRLLDDWAYQVHARHAAQAQDAGGPVSALRPGVEQEMRRHWRSVFATPGPEPVFPDLDSVFIGISFPWDRLFELRIDLA